VVIAWLTGGTPAITPIIGISTPAYLTTALAGAHLTLSTDHRNLLDAAW
jgi:aryl-alcohol dehydrogenase-like predicted oxidoreductase